MPLSWAPSRVRRRAEATPPGPETKSIASLASPCSSASCAWGGSARTQSWGAGAPGRAGSLGLPGWPCRADGRPGSHPQPRVLDQGRAVHAAQGRQGDLDVDAGVGAGPVGHHLGADQQLAAVI